MSHLYEPAHTEDPAQREEAARLQRILQAPERFVELQILHAAPARVRAGMVVLADGTDWQPDGVNGEGVYRRNAANNAWVFIG